MSYIHIREYAFLEENNKLPVIISKDLSQDEKTSLINVLKNRKQAIAWKLSDIRGIDPEFCSHKILLEDDYEPSVQHQRRVNPKIHDVIKKEVEKLLGRGIDFIDLDGKEAFQILEACHSGPLEDTTVRISQKFTEKTGQKRQLARTRESDRVQKEANDSRRMPEKSSLSQIQSKSVKDGQ
ncbi:hypothetical protein Tco_0158523 [Tanacetum coccineum]